MGWNALSVSKFLGAGEGERALLSFSHLKDVYGTDPMTALEPAVHSAAKDIPRYHFAPPFLGTFPPLLLMPGLGLSVISQSDVRGRASAMFPKERAFLQPRY
ncbi:MAG: hypothetical protein EBZ48_07995 [Proteobacteria bacterium]|nr:hypothetical protein [Pseudomonadota bacterium]